MSEPRGPSPAGILATLGAVVVAVLCCAGPALLAGGALSGIGGVLRNPWLIGVGALILAAAVIYTLRQRAARRRDSDACCPPPPRYPEHRSAQPQDGTEKRTR